MKRTISLALPFALVAGTALAACQTSAGGESIGVTQDAVQALDDGTRNLHLEDTIRFQPTQPGANVASGRALFGLAADLETGDSSGALFQGPSVAFGGTVTSNGRTCFTCHRGVKATALGLQPGPISAVVPLTDPLFTGIEADGQGDPDTMYNLDQLGLVKIRPNRFNLTRSESDPVRQGFGWRKSIHLINTAFEHGLLSDMRGRVMFEVDRGAVFSHTQTSDLRFDDLFTVQNSNDLEAFQFSILSDPRLAALLNPSDPMYSTLANDPFYTVPVATQAQKRGRDVFQQSCMTCHNTPNVFNNVSNVEALGDATRPPNFPSFAPAVGRAFNVGVAERNKFNLRFSNYDATTGHYTPIILPVAREDGSTKMLKVTTDPGLGLITTRAADVGRFKVPQLRALVNNAPYFHDNSAATLTEVIDYFNSDAYNCSADGSNYPIHLDADQRADLLAFLKIL
jgi:hypothetical protein